MHIPIPTPLCFKALLPLYFINSHQASNTGQDSISKVEICAIVTWKLKLGKKKKNKINKNSPRQEGQSRQNQTRRRGRPQGKPGNPACPPSITYRLRWHRWVQAMLIRLLKLEWQVVCSKVASSTTTAISTPLSPSRCSKPLSRTPRWNSPPSWKTNLIPHSQSIYFHFVLEFDI